MTIAERLAAVRARVEAACARAGRSPAGVTLIAVTKGFSAETVREAFEAGLRHFGENRVQEAAEKLPRLLDIRSDVTWHMIGHLQTNKVKTVLDLFDIIQSVDSFHLAEALSRRAPQAVSAFLEVNVAAELRSTDSPSMNSPENLTASPNCQPRGLRPDDRRPITAIQRTSGPFSPPVRSRPQPRLDPVLHGND